MMRFPQLAAASFLLLAAFGCPKKDDAAPPLAPRPTPTPAVSEGSLSFDLSGLAAKSTLEVLPADRVAGLPVRLRVRFDEEVPQTPVVPRERQILVMPAAEYRDATIVEARLNRGKSIDILKVLVAEKPKELERDVPLFPAPPGVQAIRAKLAYLDFKNGSGVRFVTRLVVDETPQPNDNLFLTFQGITTDGLRIVAVYWPVTVKGIPETDDVDVVLKAIQSAKGDALSPDLAKFDAFIASMEVKLPGANP